MERWHREYWWRAQWAWQLQVCILFPLCTPRKDEARHSTLVRRKYTAGNPGRFHQRRHPGAMPWPGDLLSCPMRTRSYMEQRTNSPNRRSWSPWSLRTGIYQHILPHPRHRTRSPMGTMRRNLWRRSLSCRTNGKANDSEPTKEQAGLYPKTFCRL